MMGSAKKSIRFSEKLRLDNAISMLESVINGLSAGALSLAREEELVLHPPRIISFELEARQKKDKESLSLKLDWTKSSSKGLTISNGNNGNNGHSAGMGQEAVGLPAEENEAEDLSIEEPLSEIEHLKTEPETPSGVTSTTKEDLVVPETRKAPAPPKKTTPKTARAKERPSAGKMAAKARPSRGKKKTASAKKSNSTKKSAARASGSTGNRATTAKTNPPSKPEVKQTAAKKSPTPSTSTGDDALHTDGSSIDEN